MVHDSRWAGVDVGGRRKGFHAAVVDHEGIVAEPERLPDANAVVRWLGAHRPAVVALDSPKSCAPAGERSREGERLLAKSDICGIRWTPDEAHLGGNPYFEWILCGRELYAALDRPAQRWGSDVIEVIPTASWTRWAGKRGKQRRAAWTREALNDLPLANLPTRRLNQDDRDAIAAALTARLYPEHTEPFGEIVVPTVRP